MQNVIDMYKNSGSPSRAKIILSEETKIWTGLRRNKTVKSFEAYITLSQNGTLGYYVNPNSYHIFYMPKNVVEFIPVDTMELWSRAKKAARYIINGQTHGRELDNAFENNDGDEMCSALWRMALKNKKLKFAIEKVIVSSSLQENYKKFSHLSDKELSEHAFQTRKNG